MNVWFGKLALLFNILAMVVIRAPHSNRSKKVRVVKNRQGKLEIGLLTLMWFASVIFPVLWITTSLFLFAEYSLHPILFYPGVMILIVGLFLFYRSHADLGTNWSVSLNIRENHKLIQSGIYRSIRHPMYAAIFLNGIGQALVVPNWIVGPFCFCAFILMFILRLGPEEQMMQEQFGSEYEAYTKTSKRLIPGIW